MTITATKEYKRATFNWNDELTECNHVAIGIDDNEFDSLIENKVHEGDDFDGWNVEVKF